MDVTGTPADIEAGSGAAGARAELDEMTLRRAQGGQPDACRTLVEHYQRPVFALLHRMLGGSRHDRVEDLAQETFLHVFRSLAGFAPLGPARLSTWILTIASRRAIDELRDRERAGGLLPLAEADVSSTARPDDRGRRAAMAAQVASALAELAPEYRAAFLLRFYHGLEYGEIARALDIDIGTVQSRLGRTRARLRRALQSAEERDD